MVGSSAQNGGEHARDKSFTGHQLERRRDWPWISRWGTINKDLKTIGVTWEEATLMAEDQKQRKCHIARCATSTSRDSGCGIIAERFKLSQISIYARPTSHNWYRRVCGWAARVADFACPTRPWVRAFMGPLIHTRENCPADLLNLHSST